MPYTEPRYSRLKEQSDSYLIIGLGADANHWKYFRNYKDIHYIYLGNYVGQFAFYQLYKTDPNFRCLIADNEEAWIIALPILLRMATLHETDEHIAQIAKKLKQPSNDIFTINYSDPIHAILSLINLCVKQKIHDHSLFSAKKDLQRRFNYHSKYLLRDNEYKEEKNISISGIPDLNKHLHDLCSLFIEKSNVSSYLTRQAVYDYICSLPPHKDSEALLLITAALNLKTHLGRFINKRPPDAILENLSDRQVFIKSSIKKTILDDFFQAFIRRDARDIKVPKSVVTVTKEDICNYICSLPISEDKNAKIFIEAALDPKTPLSQFMRIKRGRFFSTSVSRGTLKVLVDHLGIIEERTKKKSMSDLAPISRILTKTTHC